jgi:hypothetical protein
MVFQIAPGQHRHQCDLSGRARLRCRRRRRRAVVIEKARARTHGRGRFEIVDFLNEAAPGGPFQFVFARGCFHTFDNDQQRARFAQNGRRSRHRRHVAQPDRQHRGGAARGWTASTKCARGDERDRAGARDPGIPFGRVRSVWRGAESLAVPIAQAGDSAAAIESSRHGAIEQSLTRDSCQDYGCCREGEGIS